MSRKHDEELRRQLLRQFELARQQVEEAPAYMKPAKTDAERKAAERQRRADAGLTRLELYAHPDDHAAIKALADKLRKAREKPAVAHRR